MWSNDEYITLISLIECQVLKTYPIASSNNNHDFTANLLDVIDNWNQIAENLKRTGEPNKLKWHETITNFWVCWFCFIHFSWTKLDTLFRFTLCRSIEWHLIVLLVCLFIFLLCPQINSSIWLSKSMAWINSSISIHNGTHKYGWKWFTFKLCGISN